MNISILYGHPYDKSFNKAILEQLTTHLKQRGAAIKVKDLIQLSFDPVLALKDLEAKFTKVLPADVAKEQEDLLWADAMIIILPYGGGHFRQSLRDISTGCSQQRWSALRRGYTDWRANVRTPFLPQALRRTISAPPGKRICSTRPTTICSASPSLRMLSLSCCIRYHV